MSAEEYNTDEYKAGRLTIGHITVLVREFQHAHGLTVDGMAGPATRAAIEALTVPIVPGASADALEASGRLAVEAAEAQWVLDIYDPQSGDHTQRAEFCRAHIEAYLRACGWTWEIPYHGDGQVQWCGIFMGAMWRAAGINPAMLATFFASTARLQAWVNYRPFNGKENPKPPQGPYRRCVQLVGTETEKLALVADFAPRSGDILIVGDGTPPEGDHITIIRHFDPVTMLFHTTEGNGGGYGPHGNKIEGVVHATRPLSSTSGYHALFLMRPAPHDLVI